MYDNKREWTKVMKTEKEAAVEYDALVRKNERTKDVPMNFTYDNDNKPKNEIDPRLDKRVFWQGGMLYLYIQNNTKQYKTNKSFQKPKNKNIESGSIKVQNHS